MIRRVCSGFCAPAANGHAATVPPSSVTNSRRLIAAPEAQEGDQLTIMEKDYRCPLWVISGHTQCKRACPLCPSDRKSGHIRVLQVKDRRGVPPVSPKKVLARPRDFLGEIHRHAFWQV